MMKLALVGFAAVIFSGTAAAYPYCIDYTQTGALQGSVTECWKNLRTSYSHEKLQISMMGFAQAQNQNVIRKDGMIYSWDPATLRGTKTNDPWAETNFQGDPVKNGEAFLTAMNFTKSGQTKSIVNENCTVWTSDMMGEVCFTSDLILLEQSFSMGPMMSFTRTATRLRRGTSGDAANYSVPTNVSISEVNLPTAEGGGLDLTALMNGGLGGN